MCWMKSASEAKPSTLLLASADWGYDHDNYNVLCFWKWTNYSHSLLRLKYQ